ncbi:cytosolic carboxypeptidase 2-like isoform X1 [Bufo bufo]|uniref:cytosolic carboxypeptidase 2-like isoform X1 n=2 Tax=Bufo bufo TaxID=8384 RepID=UPI001ABE752B|nr:cytosolic carboxypeptidase 2-like isoform X1 [Bufo bufo]
MHRTSRGKEELENVWTMSRATEIQDFASDETSSSDSESDEDPYESENVDAYDLHSDNSPLYCYTQKTNQIVYEYHSGRKVARLREPRDLYGVSSNSFFQLPRWPYECQVLKEKIEHIEWDPPVPEPMYKSSGLEQEPTCANPTESKVIYQLNEGLKESYFMCSRVGGNRSPLKPVSPNGCEESDNTLVFESRFESGNLQKVVKIGDYDYQLILRTDLYTDRHTQWYYFRVKNTKAGIPYRFTIINFRKPTSLYNHGMRPLMYSETDANTQHIGWKRIGDEIKYYKNSFGREGQSYYSLSWTFRFPHSGDICYFAHCYPYTYSNLQDYLAEIANDPKRSRYCKIRVLCHSLAGNIVYVLTITNPSLATEEPKKKKAVILTARVHPGETNSSWMMKGFLDYILSSRSDAQLLRDNFVFKVVPMLNPDGVIVGNYRCSLAGRDLNRNYKSRLKDSFPSIWFTRNMIKRVMEEREILLYCDMHGHSRKQNVFMYGCKGRGGQNGGQSYLCERIFPLMLSKISPDKFSFSACKFQVQKSKEGTGRVVMWKMGIQNSYTLEATFCGSSLGKRRGTHFSAKDLQSLGYHFCDALLDYCDPDQTKYYSCLRELEEMVKQRVNSNRQLSLDSESTLENFLSDFDSSTGGSDSSDSNGPPAHLMELACKVKPQRKLLKSKRERNSQRKTPGRVLIQEPQEEDESSGENARAVIVERRMNAETSEFSSVRKLHNLNKVSKKNRMTKQQRTPLFQDISATKVSMIYLVFNAKGEVITTKSHPYTKNQDVMDITSTFNGINWKRPLPLFKNLLSQRCPFNSILEPCCYYISPDTSNSFRTNTAIDTCEHGSGNRAHNSGNFVQHKSKPMEACSPASQNSDYRGSGQKREKIDHLRHEREEIFLPDVATCRQAPLNGTDILYTTAATKVQKVQNILPKMMSHPHTSHKSSTRTRTLPPTKVKIKSTVEYNKGTVQKRKLGKLTGPCPQEDHVTTDHANLEAAANLPANTWKDILIGLQTGEGGGSVESIMLHQDTDHPIPVPPKGHMLKDKTSNGFSKFTRKPGQRVSLVPLPKTVPSSD